MAMLPLHVGHTVSTGVGDYVMLTDDLSINSSTEYIADVRCYESP